MVNSENTLSEKRNSFLNEKQSSDDRNEKEPCKRGYAFMWLFGAMHMKGSVAK